jgi:GWxTD domain-containing protein
LTNNYWRCALAISFSLTLSIDPAAQTSPPGDAEPVTLQESFGGDEDRATTHLLETIDPDVSRQYAALTRPEKGSFLETFWRDHNPFVLKYYYAHHLGVRRYSISDAFFEQNEMIIRRYRTGFPPPDPAIVDRAATMLEQLVEDAPRDPVAHSAIGYIRLEQGRCLEAEPIFEKALGMNRRFVEARCGLALSLMGQTKRKQRAFELLHETISLDPEYEAAYYARGMCHIAMVGHDRVDVDFYFGKLLEKFPGHHDGHFKLGAFFEALRYRERAAKSFTHQIAVNPNHNRASESLARISLSMDADQRVHLSIANLRRDAERRPLRFLPLLGEALIREGDWEGGGEAFDKYIQLLDPVDRAIYTDVSALMNDQAYQELQETSDRDARRGLIRRFWVLADPTPTTPLNERRIEHHRRVHHARMNFAPADTRDRAYDRRGEMHVRFGYPEHRSWSGNIVFETDSAVRAVKTRLNDRAHNALHEVATPNAVAGADFAGAGTIEIRGIPTYPLPRGASTLNDGSALGYAWENWIYTGVGGGIELTFTDRYREAEFDFVDPPMGTIHAPLWHEMSSRRVTERLVSKTPSVYTHDYDADPVVLFVDTATFRGREGKTRAEIYTGVPFRPIRGANRDTLKTVLQTEVAFYDSRWYLVHRDSTAVTHTIGAAESGEGTLIVGQTTKELRPGKYHYAVQVRASDAGKIQIHRGNIEIESYHEGDLAMSSLELAGLIRPSGPAGPFAKGDIDVVPLPSRTFAHNREVGLYYEVYNLRRDSFGSTHYRIDYTTGTTDSGFSLTSTFGAILGRTADEGVTRVSYEHRGTDSADSIHLMLNIPDSIDDRINLTVSVTDLNDPEQMTASRTTELSRFRTQAE